MKAYPIALVLAVLLAVPALAQQPMGPGNMGQQPMGPGTGYHRQGGQGMRQWRAPVIPNLVGTWQAGPFALHHKGQGFIENKDDAAKLVVTEQKGRVFNGTVEWGGKAPGKDTFSGVIDKDNITFYMAGHTDGFRIGRMEDPDAFTFYYVVPGGQNARAGYVEYKRAK